MTDSGKQASDSVEEPPITDIAAIKKRCEALNELLIAISDLPLQSSEWLERRTSVSQLLHADIPVLLSLIEVQRAWFRRYRDQQGFMSEAERLAGYALAGKD